MITIDLVAALRGVLPNELALGVRRSAIEVALGAAPNRSTGRLAILRYGNVEFHFAGPKDDRNPPLWMIFSDHAPFEGTDRLDLRTGWIQPGLPMEVALAQLADSDLTPERSRIAGVERLRVGPWVELCFEVQDVGSSLRLVAFALIDRGPGISTHR
jgi:hypothetical protein